MEEINVTGAVRLRVERPLHEKRPKMAPPFQPGDPATCLKPQFKLRQPTARLLVICKAIKTNILGQQDDLRNLPPNSTAGGGRPEVIILYTIQATLISATNFTAFFKGLVALFGVYKPFRSVLA
jgi:hypothetical protein